MKKTRKIIAVAVLSAGVASAGWGARAAGAPCSPAQAQLCWPGEYCRVDPTAQPGQQGTCAKRPDAACMMIHQPVCGVDGRTYPNTCQAALAGVDVADDKACPAS